MIEERLSTEEMRAFQERNCVSCQTLICGIGLTCSECSKPEKEGLKFVSHSHPNKHGYLIAIGGKQ